jgi:site-specific recombinase XerD
VTQNTRKFWCIHLHIFKFLCQQYGVRHPEDLQRQHILDYIDQRLRAGYAVSGINTEIHHISSFLRFLCEQGYRVSRTLLRIPGLKALETLPRFIGDEQIKKLQAHVEDRVMKASNDHLCRDALLDRAAFYLLWQAGLRLGEVNALCLEDISLQERRLLVRDGKGLKDRVVYLSERTVLALSEYLEERELGSSDHVFLYRNAPLKAGLVRDRVKAAGKRVGVKVTPHQLRHTCATQLLNAGCRVTSIQRYLGHKDLNTTMIYAHAHDETVAKDYFSAMKRIEGEVEGKTDNVFPSIPELLEHLEQPALGDEERLEIVGQLRQVLVDTGAI